MPAATAVVFAAAPLDPTPRLLARLAGLDAPYVVAADRGAATALAFGCPPDLVIGDLDSMDASTLAELQRRGIPVEEFPRDKDMTDGQLALERALQMHPTEVLLLGLVGGRRLDQTLANIGLLREVPPRVDAVLVDECNECRILRAGAKLQWQAEVNELISLVPLLGDAEYVRTEGLRWSLRGETLRAGDTRGVSNEPIATQVSVSLGLGLLLVTRHFPA